MSRFSLNSRWTVMVVLGIVASAVGGYASRRHAVLCVTTFWTFVREFSPL